MGLLAHDLDEMSMQLISLFSAITNYHKCGCLKIYTFITSQFLFFKDFIYLFFRDRGREGE